MASKCYTIETRIPYTDEIREYFDGYFGAYHAIYRYVWRAMTSEGFTKKYPKIHWFITDLCQEFNILKRTANTIRHEVQGRIEALRELKKLEMANLTHRLLAMQGKIEKLKEKINVLKVAARANQLSKQELQYYRNLKKKLYHLSVKYNKLMQSQKNLKECIERRKWSVCFGTKDLFSKQHRLQENGFRSHEGWYHVFTKKRDHNVVFLGSSDETCGNQMCQLYYDPLTDTFNLKVRKEKNWEENGKYLMIEKLTFKYQKDHLIAMLENLKIKHPSKQPLTYRFKREGTKLYLQVIITMKHEEKSYVTTSNYGTVGLDYNDGFISLSETDQCGNLIGQQHYELVHYGTGTRAENEIRTAVSNIIEYCKKKGKDLVVEDLDFNKTKSKQSKAASAGGKNYNRMLHRFDYSRYKFTLDNCAFRNKVHVIKVNPAYTSMIGKQKFGNRMKLNPHQAASYVIARKGMGINDNVSGSTVR